MQDRANVSADVLEMMKQEIIEVIKKYIDVDENAIDVRLTNQINNDGSNGAPALYANIPIINIKEDNSAEQQNENDKDIDTSNNEEEIVDIEKSINSNESTEKSQEVKGNIEDDKIDSNNSDDNKSVLSSNNNEDDKVSKE